MSASYLVDLNNTCYLGNITIGIGGPGSGLTYAASGAVIGQSCDLLLANSYCNLKVAGNEVFGSGQLRLQVQTSDTDTSGLYTDPTSGLANYPGAFQSGGILILNSGALGGGVLGAFTSGQAIASGFSVAQGFQRNLRYVRANVMSGDFFAGTLTVEFISQLKTTGSGGGATQSPSSGTVGSGTV